MPDFTEVKTTLDKRLFVHPDRCIGCKSCELACSFSHSVIPQKPVPPRIKTYTYTDEISVVVVCQQCDDAACVRTCPSGALALNNDTGVVEYRRDKCIKCGMCAVACPFGNIQIEPISREVIKCDLCEGDPVCAKYCPTSALEFAEEPGPPQYKPLYRPLLEVPWTLSAKVTKRIRRFTQVGIGVIFTNSYINAIWTKGLYEGPLRQICIPGLNCHSCPFSVLACPIGIMQSFLCNHQIPFYLIGYIALIGILVGRAACGWICPFGWLQDMMFKIKSRKFGIPKFLTHIKWVSLLLLTLLLPYFTAVHWFSKLCPYGALIGAIPWAVWNPINPVFQEPVIAPGSYGFWFVVKMVILVGFLLWFVLAKRPFCRVACPMGLIFSWFNKISLLKIEAPKAQYSSQETIAQTTPQVINWLTLEVPKAQCSGCKLCKSICPTDLDVPDEVESSACIKCLDCLACDHIEAKFSFNYGFILKKRRQAVEKQYHHLVGLHPETK